MEDLLRNAVEPRAVTLPIKISDVTGLSEALSSINSSIDTLKSQMSSVTATANNTSTAEANLSTTVTNLNATVANLTTSVNALSAKVQSLPPVPTYVDFETPVGSIDGSNSVFALNAAPSPPSSLVLTKNGMNLTPGGDYSLSGNNILFYFGAVPHAGDVLVASYRR